MNTEDVPSTNKEEPGKSSELLYRLPGVFVKAVGGHQCLCSECSPNSSSDLRNKLIRNIHREKQGEITGNIRKRLGAEAELRKILEISVTEKWKEEMESKKKTFEDTIRKDFEKNLTDEFRAKIKDEVRKELLAGLGETK